MARLLAVLLAILAIVVYLIFFKSPPPLPDMDLNRWWGPLELKGKQNDKIEPFTINFSNELVQGLRQRLNSTTQMTPPLEGAKLLQYGFNTNELGGWLKYWAEEYDFAARQRFLNQFPQYRTNIQGLNIHFIRVRPKVTSGVEVVPMLLLHGWPGSVREFYEVIPRLTSVQEGRDFAIEVIIPSLPGIGFSDGAVRPGMDMAEMAVIFRNLMQRLGFKQYYLHGGDWGAVIARNLATLFPNEILGFHTNFSFDCSEVATIFHFLGSLFPSLYVGADVADRIYPLSKYYGTLLKESGYLHIQATKPDTIGIAMSDSPAGLLAYFVEIFSAGTDRYQRPVTEYFTRDQLLDNLMYYYAGNSVITSMRMYAEAFRNFKGLFNLQKIPTVVPTWMMQAKYELGYQPPFIWRLRYPNLVGITVLHDGGHFLSLQLPEIFASDVLKAVTAFRKLKM